MIHSEINDSVNKKYIQLRATPSKSLDFQNNMSKTKAESSHNNFAPFWAAALLILVLTGLSTIWLDLGGFWKGYVLDMTGPAWNYILVRGLFTFYNDNAWRRFFTPDMTVFVLILICYGIEALQFFEVYDSTFDHWDLIAYLSILLPIYALDKRLSKIDDDR